MTDMKPVICIAVAVAVVAGILAIILPISFSTLEYYEVSWIIVVIPQTVSSEKLLHL